MSDRPRPGRAGPEAGFTLVEMLVALALFALVALASFSILDTVIRTRDRTEGRLDAVAALDRALILWSRDLGQSDPGSQGLDDGVLRFGLDGAGGPAAMSYALVDGALERQAGEVRQRIASGIADLGWRLLDREGTWHEAWPPGTGAAPLVGVEMRLMLAEGSESRPATLRRLAELPLAPAEEAPGAVLAPPPEAPLEAPP